MLIVTIISTLAVLYFGRALLEWQDRRNIKQISRLVRNHLHRKRVLRECGATGIGKDGIQTPGP